MKVRVLRAGLQTTVQAGPRSGLRHLGVPASGAADVLALALANRLVGNALEAPALEVTLSGAALEFAGDGHVAVTGADAAISLDGRSVGPHRTLPVRAGHRLEIGPARSGARTYLAFAGGIVATEELGSASTYLPAALGGLEGRALRNGDTLETSPVASPPKPHSTPAEFRPPTTTAFALRACAGAEAALLDETARQALFDVNFRVGRRADRMGLRLEGQQLRVASAGRLPSAPVFPGTIQCPEDGRPYLLSVDAQTTGGYPRVAQVARLDRHLVGQLRPGYHVRLLERAPAQATAELRAKIDYWSRWLPGIEALM